MKYNQDWFEMKDNANKDYSRAVWIPLRISKTISKEGKAGFLGYNEEFQISTSLMIPISQEQEALALGWEQINFITDHVGYYDDNDEKYIPSDIYNLNNINGTHLVLKNSRIPTEFSQWYLHQDLVLTLGLIQENDQWLRPEDGYEIVAKVERANDNRIVSLHIRASYLKDYLCACNCGLYITSFRSRIEVCQSADHITWDNNEFKEKKQNFRLEGSINEIHNGGFGYGEKMAFIHLARTDGDPEDDVPSIHGIPTDDNTAGSSHYLGHPGKKVYLIRGELWKEEWIPPAIASPIIKDDPIPSDVSFIVSGDGKTENADSLQDLGGWLWFKPDIINTILSIRNSKLSWETKNTATISCCGSLILFGINNEGFINVYAKDISYLPHWLQKKWAGSNIQITGKICSELYIIQHDGLSVETQAPEAFLIHALERIRKHSLEKLTFDIIIKHSELEEIAKKCHRFRSLNKNEFLSIAKDLAKLSADTFVKNQISKIIKLDKEGGLKSMEKLLSSKIDPKEAHDLMSPLFYIYELRILDAHLAGSQYEDLLKALKIPEAAAWPIKAYLLLEAFVDALWKIGSVIEKWDK